MWRISKTKSHEFITLFQSHLPIDRDLWEYVRYLMFQNLASPGLVFYQISLICGGILDFHNEILCSWFGKLLLTYDIWNIYLIFWHFQVNLKYSRNKFISMCLFHGGHSNSLFFTIISIVFDVLNFLRVKLFQVAP